MKILQIIPAPKYMSGVWSYYDEDDELCQEICRVACLALVEEDGAQKILPVPYHCEQGEFCGLAPRNPMMWL